MKPNKAEVRQVGSVQVGAGGCWYEDWQNRNHARLFDGRHRLDAKNLIRNYESLNDVCLLRQKVGSSRRLSLLEVGCATGEFYRYLKIRYPHASYTGVDISGPALERARKKYPDGRFLLGNPEELLPELLKRHHVEQRPQVVYSKDVLHHQTEPFRFLDQLIEIASESVILRTRTRDRGPTVWDPDLSCQYHYRGWMPYIVLNLEETIDHLKDRVPTAEIIAIRHRMILGGKENRFLPKDCYVPETGTAETAIGLFLNGRPGRIEVIDRSGEEASYTLSWRCRMMASRLFRWREGARA